MLTKVSDAVGLIYVILAIMLLIIAHFRRRRSEGDFEGLSSLFLPPPFFSR
jgi:hypothetical protein